VGKILYNLAKTLFIKLAVLEHELNIVLSFFCKGINNKSLLLVILQLIYTVSQKNPQTLKRHSSKL